MIIAVGRKTLLSALLTESTLLLAFFVIKKMFKIFKNDLHPTKFSSLEHIELIAQKETQNRRPEKEKGSASLFCSSSLV